MFGRHPRLSIDAFLGLSTTTEKKSHQDYADKLKERLKYAYEKAGEEARNKGQKYKRYYDQNVRHSSIEVGDRVLVRKVGIKGKHKLADIWESCTYIVQTQPMPDVPVYVVQKEGSKAKPRTLHRNMLLPFHGLPHIEEDIPKRSTVRPQQQVEVEETYSSDSDTSSDESSHSEIIQAEQKVPKYVIPARKGKQDSNAERPATTRPQRNRRRPNWMQSDDWQLDRPHVFSVRPEDVFYI